MQDATKASNSNLSKARAAKNDEFYTRLEDIEREMVYYKPHFNGKVVYCNCDDPRESQFWNYFYLCYEHLGLAGLISTHYTKDGSPSYSLVYDGKSVTETPLEGDGDFRSEESIALLKQADIVVSNPPFSLFRSYVAQLIEHEKQFLIIGNMNAITYKEIFPLIKENKIWLGCHGVTKFVVPDEGPLTKSQEIIGGIRYQKFGNILWFTNLTHRKRNEEIFLFRRYHDDPSEYPKYDNYDAIEVSRVINIPCDWDGVMGVPITFLTSYNPEQFWILGSRRWSKSSELEAVYRGSKDSVHDDFNTVINGKETYDRIFIKRKVKVKATHETTNNN